MINHNILNNILRSDSFRSYILLFFDLFGHTDCCVDQYGNQYDYASTVAIRTFEREKTSKGFVLLNEPQWLYKYYTAEYSDEQLFATVFGVWYGLRQEQCRLIANKNRTRFSWKILNCFLCGMSYEEVKTILTDRNKSTTTKESLLNACKYSGTCVIYIDGKKVDAIIKGDVLTDNLNKTQYCRKEWL